MPTTPYLDEPEHWRSRAQQIRALAEQMNDHISRAMMLQIASDYERLAFRAEARRRRE